MLARRLLVGLACLLFAALPAIGQTPEQPALSAPQCAKTWVGRAPEIEEYIRTAEIVRLEDIPVGVTRPLRGELAPGGPVSRIAWKQLRPGMRQGFWESYKSEIAAYELDKLLGLNMVPPKTEKRVKGEPGVAIMWAAPTRTFNEMGGVPNPPAAEFERWNRQVIRAKMFHNLIGDPDPNLGNWLVDPDWDLILIDQSRAFTTTKNLVHKEMVRIDGELWDRMKALDEATIEAALGDWLRKNEVRAILARRDRMEKMIDEMVSKRGPSVFVR